MDLKLNCAQLIIQLPQEQNSLTKASVNEYAD